MKRIFFLNAGLCTLIFISTIMGSCKSSGHAVHSSENSNQAVPSGSQIGYLSVLWISAADFANTENGKIIFSFRMMRPDSISINGWKGRGTLRDTYDTIPSLVLQPWANRNVPYGAGTYFGNLVLRKNVLKDLKKQSKASKKAFVIFTPYIEGNNVYYSISFSNSNSGDITAMDDSVAATAELNPSPPKKY